MPGGPGYGQDATVKVGGSELTAQLYGLLLDVRVEQSVSMASRFSLRFSDPDFEILDADTFAIGTAVEISMETARSRILVFKGEILSLSSEQTGSLRHELVVGGYDKAHRLARATKIHTYQNMTYSAVVSAIASDHGLTPDVQSTSITFPYLVQSTTDYAFLSDLAFRVGYEWCVDGDKLVFKRRAFGTPMAVTFGNDLARFKARYSIAEHSTQVTVRSWDPATQQAVVGVDASDVVSTDKVIVGSNALLASRGRNGVPVGKVESAAAVAETQGEAEALAKSLGRRLAGAEFSARGEAVGRPDLKAGGVVTIKGVGRSLSGDYYLTTVEHVVGGGKPLTTRFTVGGVEPSGLVDLLGRGADRLGAWGKLGVAIGVVTNNNDPDGLGRVKVKFPSLSDDEESNWARLVSPGAGQSGGMMFMPQVNDEVLVAFEQGDRRRPYVLGGMWNGRHAPPSTDFLDSDGVMDWTVKTRHGHKLVLRDGTGDDKRHLSLILADGQTKIFVGQDKVEIIANNKPLQLKSGSGTVTLDGHGAIELKGTNITIEAQQDLKLKGLNIEATASANLKAKAGMLEIASTGPGKVESSAVLELKGSLLKIN